MSEYVKSELDYLNFYFDGKSEGLLQFGYSKNCDNYKDTECELAESPNACAGRLSCQLIISNGELGSFISFIRNAADKMDQILVENNSVPSIDVSRELELLREIEEIATERDELRGKLKRVEVCVCGISGGVSDEL